MIAYRTESLYGSGVRDVEQVLRHEIVDKGNETLLEKLGCTMERAVEILKEQGMTECVWVVSTPYDLMKYYPPLDGITAYEVDEIKFTGRWDTLCTIPDGTLIAYDTCEVKYWGRLLVPIENTREFDIEWKMDGTMSVRLKDDPLLDDMAIQLEVTRILQSMVPKAKGITVFIKEKS